MFEAGCRFASVELVDVADSCRRFASAELVAAPTKVLRLGNSEEACPVGAVVC